MARFQSQAEAQDDLGNTGIIVRCFTSVGTISGMGKVDIEAREFISLDSHHVQQFVGVHVTSSAEYSQTAFTTVAYDDVTRQIAAIDRLSAFNPHAVKYKQIEVEFSLESGLKLVVFNDGKGKLMFSVTAQTATAYFGDLLRLGELKRLISKAKIVIDENRPRREASRAVFG